MAPSFSKITHDLYFIFYCKTGEIKEISKSLFSRLEYPVICVRNHKYRVVGCVSRTKTKQVLSSLETQGLIGEIVGTVKDISSFGSLLFGALGKITSVSKRDILTIFSSFIKIIDMFNTREFSPLNVTGVMLDIYLIYTSFSLETQGLECLASMACANFLPDKLFSVIKKSQYLSSVKILDDLSYFHDFLITIVEAFEWVIDKIPFPQCLRSFIDSVMLTFKNTSDHLLIRDMERILFQAKDCKIFLDLSFREKSKRLNEKFEKSHAVKDWSRRSASLLNICLKWTRHMKIILAYEDPGRVEPTCFIFEGPPGKKKSVVMNAVVEALGEPFYAHCVKAVMDGKDFYDNYNNEPIFYMDDVGQNGVSQWRPLMNMVSSVKLPLDCAEAQNKDTKFFNSSKILVTTNRFQTLNLALTKQDCIDDIEALWRRGNIFDFTYVESTPDFIKGKILFKHFDLNRKVFVNAFPAPFVKEMRKRNCDLQPFLDINDRSQLLVWMCKIVKIFDLLKRNYAVNNRLTNSEKEIINLELSNLEFLDAETGKSYPMEIIESLISEFISTALQYTMSISNFVFDNAWWFAALAICGLGLAAVWWFDSNVYWEDDGMRYVAKAGNNGVISYGYSDDGRYAAFKNDPNNLPAKPHLFDMYTDRVNGMYKLADLYRSHRLPFDDESFKFDPKNAHNSVISLQKSVKNITARCSEGDVNMRCILSGRSIIAPAHLTSDSSFSIIVYDDKLENKRIIDGDLVRVVYRNPAEDIMVCKLRESYPAPFKNLSKWFKDEVNHTDPSFLVSSEIIAPVGSFASDANLCYGSTDRLVVKDAFLYKIQFSGLCGSPIFSPREGIMGVHVAGSGTAKVGVGMAWSTSTRLIIRDILLQDKNLLPIDTKVVDDKNISVVKLDKKMQVSAITKSNIGPSPLHGIFPINRSPAQLDKYGRFTVKEVGKAAFAIPGKPEIEEVEFARKAVIQMFDNFGDLPWDEVVNGNSLLNGLNKKSSNGFECYPEKEKYIDFESGTLTDFCVREIKAFEMAVEDGTMTEDDWKKLFWVEVPKDEVRNNSKEGVPRTFRVGTIIQQILSKRYFGKFVESVIQQRSFNQVMVGINPVKEWPVMYENLVKGKIFAGDVAKWDKGMVPEFQRTLFDAIMDKYVGSNPKVAALVLECLIHSIVVMLDDLYITTHSLASGHFLTAIFNSLINRMYTAGWYYRSLSESGKKPQVHEFFKDVVDYVYGDDKLNSVKKHHKLLNAITMRDYFESLGLGFTDASKKPIEAPFQDISEVSFLKRSFKFHNLLGKIVCPLELEVLQSGLSWVDYTKDIALVMDSKIDNYQREIFLHTDRDFLLLDLENRLTRFNRPLNKLPRSYLLELYSDSSDYEPPFGSNSYL